MHFPSKKQIACSVIVMLIALIYIFFPHPASDLYLRITFEELEGDTCYL